MDDTLKLEFGKPIPKELLKKHANPCLRVYGKGPEGKTCKRCQHLFAVEHGHRYYKCDLRKLTKGPGSDHRVRWPACGRYEEREGDEHP